MLSPEGFLAGLAVAVLLPFFLRIYRTGMRDFVNIDDEFFGYRKGSFVGAETTILFSDKRVDRFAPSEFLEFGGPYVAIFICRDRRGQHWLWRLYRPTEARPTLAKLTPLAVEEMLQRKVTLLKELCPKQKRLAAPAAPSEKPKRLGLWD